MHSTIQPVTPGAIIGYRADGRPVRLIGGGSEPAPPPAAPAEPPPAQPAPPPAAPAPPAVPAAQAEPAAPAGDAAPPPAADSIDALPPWAQKLIRDTRGEAAANRTKAKEHADALTALEQAHGQQLDGIAKALGLKPEEATPEQIAAERDTERARAEDNAARAKAAAVELAVFRAASAVNVSGNALLDSRAFVATLAGLDPSAEDFAQQVMARITAAAEQNPAWKTAPASAPAAPALPVPAIPASGPAGSFTSAPPGPRQLTVEDTHSMSPSQLQNAINQGLLTDAGYGARRSSRR